MKKILTIFAFLILLTTYVSAFGVTAFYWDERPLVMNPGQTKEVQLYLSNEKSVPPISLNAELSTGADIAQLTGETIFELDTGENSIPVDITITIPEEAEIGKEYKVGVQFTTAAKPGNKMLALGTRITKTFPVVVGKVIEPKKSLLEIIPTEAMGTIAILALIALALFLIKKKKKK